MKNMNWTRASLHISYGGSDANKLKSPVTIPKIKAKRVVPVLDSNFIERYH